MSLRQLCKQWRGSSRGLHSAMCLSQEEGRVPIPQALRAEVEKAKVTPGIPAMVSKEAITNWELERLRMIPKLKTFYSGNPVHEEYIAELNALIRKYCDLPTKPQSDGESQYNFIGFQAYKKMANSGVRLKETHHSELASLLHRLKIIDSELMPQEVKDVLKKFSVKTDIFKQVKQIERQLDEYGRAYAVGRRKRAEAEVWLVKGDGQSQINGKPLVEYFPLIKDRKSVAYPFQVIAQEGQYNIFAKVSGGGTSAQAEAIMYGISRAITIFNPLLKTRLRKADLMSRDSRRVERKKAGRVKARKMPTWVKR